MPTVPRLNVNAPEFSGGGIVIPQVEGGGPQVVRKPINQIGAALSELGQNISSVTNSLIEEQRQIDENRRYVEASTEYGQKVLDLKTSYESLNPDEQIANQKKYLSDLDKIGSDVGNKLKDLPRVQNAFIARTSAIRLNHIENAANIVATAKHEKNKQNYVNSFALSIKKAREIGRTDGDAQKIYDLIQEHGNNINLMFPGQDMTAQKGKDASDIIVAALEESGATNIGNFSQMVKACEGKGPFAGIVPSEKLLQLTNQINDSFYQKSEREKRDQKEQIAKVQDANATKISLAFTMGGKFFSQKELLRMASAGEISNQFAQHMGTVQAQAIKSLGEKRDTEGNKAIQARYIIELERIKRSDNASPSSISSLRDGILSDMSKGNITPGMANSLLRDLESTDNKRWNDPIGNAWLDKLRAEIGVPSPSSPNWKAEKEVLYADAKIKFDEARKNGLSPEQAYASVSHFAARSRLDSDVANLKKSFPNQYHLVSGTTDTKKIAEQLKAAKAQYDILKRKSKNSPELKNAKDSVIYLKLLLETFSIYEKTTATGARK